MAGSVNTFWSSIENEPKRQYKYVVEWGDVPWFVVTSIAQPKYELGETVVSALNHDFKYPGRIKWQDVQLEITDSENINVANILIKKLLQSGYAFPTSGNQYRTISKKGCVQALGQLILKEITGGEFLGAGPTPQDEAKIIGEWKFTNAWIKSFDAGQNTYTSDEAKKITLTVVYDYAAYTGYEPSNRPFVQ